VLPSARSVAAGLVVALVGAAGYGAARQTGAFAVEEVVVRGAPPSLAREVGRTLAPLRGSSLLTVDGSEVVRRAHAVPRVASATYDRAFPNTLVVTVRPERAVALVRRGAGAWLVSAEGRVLARVPRARRSAAPRVWVSRRVPLELGARLPDPVTRAAIAAAAALRQGSLPVAVRTVTVEKGILVFVLTSGLELRLGDGSALPLKFAVAEELIHSLPSPGRGGPRYLDLVVPSRPVAGPPQTAPDNTRPEDRG
jgi:cell division septal protein FtsQ